MREPQTDAPPSPADAPLIDRPGANGNGNGHPAHDVIEPGLDVEARQQLLAEPREPEPQAPTVDQDLPLAEPAQDRRRLVAPAEPEPAWKRWLYAGVAIVLAALHSHFTSSYWAPAHWGNNQNGYLVGGKYLATTLRTTGFEPTGPFEFVGWMWVMGDEASTAAGGGMHYPKYPIGIPLAYAVVYRIGLALHNEATAINWVFRVSPVAMTLALLGTFFLTRRLASSFAGLLAMILLGTLPLTLILTNNPNSHALSLCFIIWGMYALVRWWETLSWWRGLIAGFLLGYAVTIRYTEGLLLLPMAIAGLLTVRYRPAWIVSWWRVGVWALFACAALVVSDALGQETFEWQKWLTASIGTKLAWWHRLAFVAVPLLATVRWSALDRTLIRDALLGGEWVRSVMLALVVLAATFFSPPRLETTTPDWLHTIRLLTSVAFFVAAVVLVHTIRWRELRTWAPAATLAIGWLIPVVFLVAFNKLTVGSITGYDTTNESSGFTYKHFMAKWQDTVNQLYNQGLYFILPVALVGLFMAFRWSWRAGLLLFLWFVPGTLLYMAYYYGRGMPLIGYLRFFTSMLPAAVIAAVWVVHKASVSMRAEAEAAREGVDPVDDAWVRRWWRSGSISAPLAAGVFVAVPALTNLNSMLGPMERDGVIATNLSDVARRARDLIPDNAIVFGHSQRLLNYLQFAGKDAWRYYGADYFRNGFPVPHMGSQDPDDPNPIQPARKQFLKKAYDGLDNDDMVRVQNEIMTSALNEKRHVFVVLEKSQFSGFRRSFLSPSKWDTKVVQQWVEPARMSTVASRSLASLGADMGGRSSPQTWQIVEVKLKPQKEQAAPSTAPATAPAVALEAAPATSPAAAPSTAAPTSGPS